MTLLQKACRPLTLDEIFDDDSFENGHAIIQSLLAKGASADLINRHYVSPLTLVENYLSNVSDVSRQLKMKDIHKLLKDSISEKYSQNAVQAPVSHLISWFKSAHDRNLFEAFSGKFVVRCMDNAHGFLSDSVM